MKTLSYNLLPATTFGTAVDNYDGIATTFSGVPVKASAYYSKAKDTQTASWYLTNFTGKLLFEATLDADPDSANYSTIATVDGTVTPVTINDFVNLKGKYTWIRATVTDFTAGSIQKVSLGY